MSLYKMFKTDKSVENAGVWLDYGDCRIRVRRAGGSNQPFLRAMEKIGRKNRRKIELDVLREEDAQKMMLQVYADTIIVDWEGVQDEDGKELPCTRENVIKVFKELPDLFKDVQAEAGKLQNFLDAINERDEKN